VSTLRTFWRGPWPWVLAGLALAVYAIARHWIAPPAEQDPRPIGTAEDILALRDRRDLNVLFILIDTLRAEHLSSYGYSRATSPTIDFIASQGVRFGHHLSQSSWTKCSMASLWTSLYPQHSGVTRYDDVLPDEAHLPAEILSEAGFRTAGLWRNGWVEGYFGFDQGFQTYTRPNVFPVPPEVRRENPTAVHGGTDQDLVRSAEEFLSVNSDQRWFLYLHMMDVHEYTYDPGSAQFGTGYKDIYDNAVLFVNHTLDALFYDLYQRGLLDKTLIVIASDHGEAFGERGSEGHARTVYPETTEVPFVIGFPFRLEAPIVLRQRTANVDIWPTLLDLLGLPAMDAVDGRSRLPEILAAARREEVAADGERLAIAHLDTSWGQRVRARTPMVSVAEQRFRYVAFHNAKGEVTREELFDGELGDRKERENRLDAEPEVAERLRQVERDYVHSPPAWQKPRHTLQIDEIQLNQLRALGYQVP
jgi:arylsulfatase A-like enzyme